MGNATPSGSPTPPVLTENLPQILLLVATNAFVGGMVGIERTVLPLIAEADFGLASTTAALAFIATFGMTKAAMNFVAGGLSDRWGRRRLLILGWLIGLPVPLILMYAPSWTWILVANVLLGANQSLTWSMTVVMKVDLAGPDRYGLVIGWNEFAGYAGLATAAVLTGIIASTYGLRPEPFYLGLILALVGLVLSCFTRDTQPHHTPRARPASHPSPEDQEASLLEVLRKGTYGDAALAAASQAGLVTNLKDGALWGLLPLLLASRDLSLTRIGAVVALYPIVWAVGQLYFGPLSDRIGRRGIIGTGMVCQGLGVASFALANGFPAYLGAAALTGLGTAMVYPTLLALVSDVAKPSWRASALGVYRWWRDLGYAVGALGAGVIADTMSVEAAMWAVAGLCLFSGVFFRARA